MTTLGGNERARQAERDKDRATKSLNQTLGPTQQGLFVTLSTDDLWDLPNQTNFMRQVLALCTLTAAVNQISQKSPLGKGPC